MYAQYQNYQQPNQSVTASQGAMTWDAQRGGWVPSTGVVVASSTHSTYNNSSSYQQQQPAQMKHQQQQQQVIPPNPVQTYTDYYHGWQAHGKECEEYLRRLTDQQQRSETQRRIDWAKYYADESSRAAHHFYSNPHATSAPFELPPAPPQTQSNQQQQQSVAASQQQQQVNNNNPYQQHQQQQQQQQPRRHNHITSNTNQSTPQSKSSSSTPSSSDENTPGGLNSYVKRCMDQCTTDQQKKAVQADVEKVIAEAIQKGNLHTRNWEYVPLIPVPGASAVVGAQQQQHISFSITPQKHSNNNNINHNRHFNNNNRGGGKYSRQYDDKLPVNDSYYGRSGGGTTTSPNNNNIDSSRFGRQRSPPMNGNFYGPASSSSHNTNPLSPSQKRSVVTPEEDFIEFQQQQQSRRNNKKQRKSGSNNNGFERSTQALAKRANRFSGPGGIQEATASSSSVVNGHDQYMGKKLIGGSNKVLDEEDFQKMTVKGTCLKLEKEYLRLTAPPKAELVRPQPILERHLDNLKKDYESKKRDYLWFCSQFKAMRQDCTVQRIQSRFTVDVYETHARIALQEGDLNEYNQCQTQLKELYESGYTMGNESEFIAYRLLYYCLLSTNEKYDGGSSDMFKILLSLTAEQRMDRSVAHALKTREALTSGDYIQFFRLHKDSPGLSRYLSDRIVPTMRMRGLRRMVKAYRPSLEVDVFKSQLGFDSIEECTKFLASCGCVLDDSNCITKDSNNIHEPVEEKKNSLI